MIDYITPAQRLAGATSPEAKRAAAIAYLRSRRIYILDHDCKFKPTGKFGTDVAATWAKARQRSAKRKKAPQ